MHSVYDIGIKLTMAGNAAAAINILGKSVLGLNHNIIQAQGAMNGLKVAAIGAGLAFAGIGLIKGVMATVEAAKELNNQQTRMLAAGLSNKDVAEATATAWRMTGQVMGTAVDGNLAAIGHLRAQFGDLSEAQRIAPAYMKEAVALGVLTGKDGEGEAYKIAQAVHLSGRAVDPNTHRLNADAFVGQMAIDRAIIAASQGKITTNDILQFQKMGGDNVGLMSDQGRINATGFIAAMGGMRAGTALTASNRALFAGVMPKATMQQLAEMGILDGTKIQGAKGGFGADSGAIPGGNVRMGKGSLINEQQFIKDPFGWVWTTLIPKLESKGIVGADAQIEWLKKAKLNVNTTRLLSEAIRNKTVDQQEARNVAQARTVTGYEAVKQNNIGLNQHALSVAKDNFMAAVGIGLAPVLVPLLQKMTKGVQAATDWVVAHKDKVALIGKILLGVGVFLTVFGTILVGVGVFMAAAALGISAPIIGIIAGISLLIAGVVALFLFVPWKKVGHFLMGLVRGVVDFAIGVGKAIFNFIFGIAKWELGIVKAIADWLIGVWNGFISGAGAFFGKLKDWFTNLLKGLGDWVTGQKPPAVPKSGSSDPHGIETPGVGVMAPAAYRPAVSSNNRPIMLRTSVQVDRREIASAVSTHWSDDLTRQPNGPSDYNQAQGYVPGVQRV